jgi:hypothetical protein
VASPEQCSLQTLPLRATWNGAVRRTGGTVAPPNLKRSPSARALLPSRAGLGQSVPLGLTSNYGPLVLNRDKRIMARSSKHRASKDARHQISTKTVYSTVEPTLEEKLLLPRRFRKADEWPVTKIIAERAGKYLVEWEPHPTTGALWKPEWVRGFHLGLHALWSDLA